jgi:hypothetical protein
VFEIIIALNSIVNTIITDENIITIIIIIIFFITIAKVKIETREGVDGMDRLLHETRCEWGSLDGYAARFRRGKLYKYKGTDAGSGIPLGIMIML